MIIITRSRVLNNLIQYEYGIISKPETVGNPQYNYTIKHIHQSLGNFIITFEHNNNNCVNKYDPWKGILAGEDFDF